MIVTFQGYNGKKNKATAVVSAIAAMIFDSQFIVIQRYNRPRVLKSIETRKRMRIKSNQGV